MVQKVPGNICNSRDIPTFRWNDQHIRRHLAEYIRQIAPLTHNGGPQRIIARRLPQRRMGRRNDRHRGRITTSNRTSYRSHRRRIIRVHSIDLSLTRA